MTLKTTIITCASALLLAAHSLPATAQQTTVEVYEAFYADPANVLRYAYQNYQTAWLCHEGRKDRTLQYVSSADLDAARDNARAVEAALTAKYPDLDKETAWADVTARFGDIAFLPDAKAKDPISQFTVDTYTSAMRGATGAERSAYFVDGVRNATRPQSVERVRAICGLAISNLGADAVRLSSTGGTGLTKDF